MKKTYLVACLLFLINIKIFAQQWLVFGGLPNNATRSVTISNQNDVWVATFGGGISKMINGGYINYNLSNSGLTDNFTSSINTDNNGDLWIGSYNTGAFRYNGSSWMNFTTSNGLPGDRINCIEVDKSNNNIWFGINFNGAVVYNGSTFVNYRTTNSSLPNNNVNAITLDNEGNKWIATMAGLAKLNGSNWTIYSTSTSGIAGNQIYCVKVESPNEIWVGTNNGLCKFDGNNTWIVYDEDNSGLPFNYVNSVSIDSDNNKWIGTTQGGMAKFDGNGTWEVFNTSNSDLPGMDVRQILIDSDDNKWITTNDGGLAFYGEVQFASLDIEANVDSMCLGQKVLFSVVNTNGAGSEPEYQWLLNGNNVGFNSDTFSISNLTEDDIISCLLTSNSPIAVGSPATSNSINIPLKATINNTVSVFSNLDSICSNTEVTFYANSFTAGISPIYQWYVNEIIVSGNNDSVLVYSSFSNGDSVYCIMQSSLECVSPISAYSNSVILFVSELTLPTISQNNDTLFCTTTQEVIFRWYLNDELINANNSFIIIDEEGSYKVEIENDFGCTSISESFNATLVNQNKILSNKNKWQIYPNPIMNDDFLFLTNDFIDLNEKIYIKIINTLGQEIYETKTICDGAPLKIPVDTIDKGLYFLEVYSGKRKDNFKIIKN
jgi:streptogramin lyase